MRSEEQGLPSCSVRVSALALLKMAMHAKSGGNIEIMGMLQVCFDSIYVQWLSGQYAPSQHPTLCHVM